MLKSLAGADSAAEVHCLDRMFAGGTSVRADLSFKDAAEPLAHRYCATAQHADAGCSDAVLTAASNCACQHLSWPLRSAMRPRAPRSICGPAVVLDRTVGLEGSITRRVVGRRSGDPKIEQIAMSGSEVARTRPRADAGIMVQRKVASSASGRRYRAPPRWHVGICGCGFVQRRPDSCRRPRPGSRPNPGHQLTLQVGRYFPVHSTRQLPRRRACTPAGAMTPGRVSGRSGHIRCVPGAAEPERHIARR